MSEPICLGTVQDLLSQLSGVDLNLKLFCVAFPDGSHDLFVRLDDHKERLQNQMKQMLNINPSAPTYDVAKFND